MAIEELVGALPTGWHYVTLGQACGRGGGGVQTGPFGSQLHAADYVPSGVPSIMPQNIGDNRIVRDGIAQIRPADAERLARYRVRPGDIVYSRRGDVEKRALIRESEDGWLCGTGCLRIRFGAGHVDPRYASYYLGDARVREWIVRHAHGATMPNLNTGILSSLPFALPPLPDQLAIASILDALDNKVELNRQVSQSLEAMTQTLFKSWFVDFDPVRAKSEGRSSGLPQQLDAHLPESLIPSSAGRTPTGWRTASLMDQTDADRGVSYKGAGLSDHGMPMHNLNSIKEGGGYKYGGIKYYTGDHRERHRVTPGDCIVVNTEQGRDRMLIGHAAIVPAIFGEEGLISHHLYRLRPKAGSPFTAQYLCHLLNDPVMHDIVSGYSNGTTVNMLPVDALKSPVVVVPPRALVHAFDRLALDAQTRMEVAVRNSATLVDLRDALLPKLLSGDLRVPDAERLAVGAGA